VVSLWEVPLYIDDYSFEWDPDLVLMHFALIPGSRIAPGCTDVTWPAPLLHIVPNLEPIVPYLGSCWHPDDLTLYHVVLSTNRSLRRPSADSRWHDIFQFWVLPGLYFLQNGPYILVIQFSLLKAAGPQTTAIRAAGAHTCLTCACALTLWQCVHSSQHRHQHCCVFGLDGARKWKCIVVGTESNRRFVPWGS
jgi:hypothetical protein